MGASASTTVIIVTVVLFAISLLAVCLRCVVRLRLVRAFGSDDMCMIMAMMLNIGLFISVIIGAQNGMGKDVAYLASHPEARRRGFLCWWLGELLYVSACTAARLSIALTLLRVAVGRAYSCILYATMGLSTVAGTVFFFFTVFQCSPVSSYWDRPGDKGACLDIDLLLGIVYAYSGVAVLCDFTIGLLPVMLIRHLQLSRRTKISLMIVLGIGGIAGAAVIVRIPYLHLAKKPDFLHATSQIAIWSNAEASLGITAGSLATVRPLLRRISEAITSIRSQYTHLTSRQTACTAPNAGQTS